MVFALLIAASCGISAPGIRSSGSSSHTLIARSSRRHWPCADARRDGTSGVDWGKATEIATRCCCRPVRLCMAAILLWLLKFHLFVTGAVHRARRRQPPPLWIRGILIATCTASACARLERRPEGHGLDHG